MKLYAVYTFTSHEGCSAPEGVYSSKEMAQVAIDEKGKDGLNLATDERRIRELRLDDELKEGV